MMKSQPEMGVRSRIEFLEGRLERGKIMESANKELALNEANTLSSDDTGDSQKKVQITIKDGAIWMPIYTRPLHEFRLCEYCKEHDIPFYLPLVPGFKIHNVYKGQKRHTYKKEIMKPMLSSYIFAQLTEDQRKQIWRSNSINSIWNVSIEEQSSFVDELHGLQMMETLALSSKLEFKKEIQANDRFVIEAPQEYEGTYGYLIEKRKRFWWVVRLEFLGQYIETQIDPSDYVFRRIDG
jgi:hypothetical protein